MIQLIQFRIGNLVDFEGNFEVVVGVDVFEDRIKTGQLLGYKKPDNIWKPISGYQYIPLTEEWLERFGFYSNSSDDCWIYRRSLGSNLLTIVKLKKENKPDIYWCTELNPYNNDGDVEYEKICGLQSIAYVHELQNLVYGLEGEVLTLNKTT